ncbi:MAG: Nudix family hydrolase [Thiobacillaceae bacterium]|nr:Nudix family hydrolase [Thiobacillaceae bacterium]MCX7674186.1 Nudix family hydrolase [Thiobacillaceae bacterium]MDW8322876.1 Nudix family hydrolase [Burkholderiales bacterium]
MNARVQVAAAVVERPDGAFLMARRPAGKAYAGWWEFPGGKLEPGESPHQALVRELQEELGLTVECAHPWLTLDHDYAHARVRLNFFRVPGWRGTPRPHEGQDLAWVRADRPAVAPILPANGPILRALALPLVYGVSAASELGAEAFLARLERRLAEGLRLIQLREKALPPAERAALAGQVAELCRRYDATLLVNDDLDLAERLGLGVHLPAARLMQMTRRPGVPWVAASCHDARELERAQALGVDFVVLGPVLPTASHPGAPTLGWAGFQALAAARPLPVYAIGGLHGGLLATARAAGAHGIAVKQALWT